MFMGSWAVVCTIVHANLGVNLESTVSPRFHKNRSYSSNWKIEILGIVCKVQNV